MARFGGYHEAGMRSGNAPRRAPRPCAHHGCRALVVSGSRCPQHQRDQQQSQRRYNARRPESDRYYGTADWKRLRSAHLASHPLCVICHGAGLVVGAVVVDHIIPTRDRPDLMLDAGNLRSLCRRCHDQHGARTGGGARPSRGGRGVPFI